MENSGNQKQSKIGIPKLLINLFFYKIVVNYLIYSFIKIIYTFLQFENNNIYIYNNVYGAFHAKLTTFLDDPFRFFSNFYVYLWPKNDFYKFL